MKNVGRQIAILGLVACAGGVQAQARCQAAAPPEASVPANRLAWPSFCDIPPAPKHVPSAAAFRADVVDTRLAGRAVVRATAPGTFSLSGTDRFAETARREAAPPPPMTPPGESDTAAFVAKARALAKPPPRPH